MADDLGRSARSDRPTTGAPSGARRAPTGARVAAALIGVLVGGFGCASLRVADLDAFETIPMDRILPYPTKEEMRKRSYEVVVVDRPADSIDRATLDKPRAQVRRRLERLAAQAGAVVIAPSRRDGNEARTEGDLEGLEEGEGEDALGADYALAARFATLGHDSVWAKPSRFPWQSVEDVSQKPGICTHSVQVSLEVQVFEAGQGDHAIRTYALDHSGQQKNKDLDPACAIAPVTLEVLFENTLDQALSCIEGPLGAMLLPRGHVVGHRRALEAERHIYRVTLGAAHGIEFGDEVEIRREQRATSPSGEPMRSEWVIARGVVSDQVESKASWIALDPAKAESTILDGDVVRPRQKSGLLTSLSGPNCSRILEER
ncbi:MAG: hypothetical protein CL908_08485 [Deltaproteobacteria bacterium]|nr:hypothetical protein [Deltaproteobacteria bacterium]